MREWKYAAACAVALSVADVAAAHEVETVCASYESGDRLLAVERELSGGGLLVYDEDVHADIGAVVSHYWAARLSHDAGGLVHLFPKRLRADELEEQLRLHESAWASERILKRTTKALALRAVDGECVAVVYSEVLALVRDNRCIRDAVAIAVLYDSGWRLVPSQGGAGAWPMREGDDSGRAR